MIENTNSSKQLQEVMDLIVITEDSILSIAKIEREILYKNILYLVLIIIHLLAIIFITGATVYTPYEKISGVAFIAVLIALSILIVLSIILAYKNKKEQYKLKQNISIERDVILRSTTIITDQFHIMQSDPSISPITIEIFRLRLQRIGKNA
jgi:hypothetical protein